MGEVIVWAKGQSREVVFETKRDGAMAISIVLVTETRSRSTLAHAELTHEDWQGVLKLHAEGERAGG